MMHHLLGRLAHFGGEGALYALFFISIISFGAIGQRVWFFIRRRLNTDRFVKQLVPLLRGRDLSTARALSQRANSSVNLITLAGLLQADNGLPAVEYALETAIARERIQLDDKLILLNELGRIAFLIGVLGTLCDMLALPGPSENLPPTEVAGGRPFLYTMTAAVTPTIGGFLVAIPAWLAASAFKVHVQRIGLECEYVARLVCSQLAPSGQTTANAPIPHPKLRSIAA